MSAMNFIRQNQVDITNIASVLKDAKDIFQLQSYRSEIKNEIERLKQNKNNQQYLQNNLYYPLKPLPKINWNYPIYYF
jgi:flagellar biosynthesis/type III secretory pathway chaperone